MQKKLLENMAIDAQGKDSTRWGPNVPPSRGGKFFHSSIVEEPNRQKKRSNETFCVNAQYPTLGELPLSCNLTQFAGKRANNNNIFSFSTVKWWDDFPLDSLDRMKLALPSGSNKSYCSVDAYISMPLVTFLLVIWQCLWRTPCIFTGSFWLLGNHYFFQ